MAKYKDELKKNGDLQERIVFLLNDKISSFGQSYFRPLTYLLIVSLLHWLVILGYEKYSLLLVQTYPVWLASFFSYIFCVLNDIASNVPLSTINKKEGMEFMSLLFNVIYGVLIWQIIVSIKRRVRR